MKKIPKQEYTTEFKEQAVLQGNDGLQAQSADCTESAGSEFQPDRA
jgi:hypothetical protein